MLAHKTMTLRVNVPYKGMEAVKSGTPCWFPVFLLLMRSLWRTFAPEVQARRGLGLPFLTALCSLQTAAFAGGIDY